MSAVAVHLVAVDVEEEVAFLVSGLGASETSRLVLPGERLLTVDLLLEGMSLAVAGEFEGTPLQAPSTLGATSLALRLTVQNADRALDRAVAAGASVFEPVADAFWGVRTGQVLDPSGHRWAFDQHLRDVPAEELREAAARAFGGDPH